MKNIVSFLSQLISVDRHHRNIAVFYLNGCIFAGLSTIKLAISIYPILTVFQKRMTQNILRIIMHVLPHQWHDLTVVMFKCIFTNGTPIRTSQIVFSRISTKITLHPCRPPLKFVSLLLIFQSHPKRLYFYFLIHQPQGLSMGGTLSCPVLHSKKEFRFV